MFIHLRKLALCQAIFILTWLLPALHTLGYCTFLEQAFEPEDPVVIYQGREQFVHEYRFTIDEPGVFVVSLSETGESMPIGRLLQDSTIDYDSELEPFWQFNQKPFWQFNQPSVNTNKHQAYILNEPGGYVYSVMSDRVGLEYEIKRRNLSFNEIVCGEVVSETLPPYSTSCVGDGCRLNPRICNSVYIGGYYIDTDESSFIAIEELTSSIRTSIFWESSSGSFRGNFTRPPLDSEEQVFTAVMPSGRNRIIYIAFDRYLSCFGSRDRQMNLLVDCSEADFASTTVDQASNILEDFSPANWQLVDVDMFASPTAKFGEELVLGKSNDSGGQFGYIELVDPMPPLPKGEYEIKLDTEFLSSGILHPEYRLRAFTEDGLIQKIKTLAFEYNEDTPESVTLNWKSDGSSYWNLAVDLLSFNELQSGKLEIRSIEVLPFEIDSALRMQIDQVNEIEEEMNCFSASCWDEVTLDSFTPPLFNIDGTLELFPPANSSLSFGFLESDEDFPPLPEGKYFMHFEVEPILQQGDETDFPEYRIRVLTESGLKQQIESFAIDDGRRLPAIITVPWYSDGNTRWRVAIDSLAFSEPKIGAIRIKGISLESRM